jgi:probable phosphoglycerate mutase
MELFLVRHGQPDWHPGQRMRNDPELTPLGHEQARLLATRDWGGVDELWVSPLVRARQTAEPLAEALGLEPRVSPWLAEITNPPHWDGSPWDEVSELFATLSRRPVEEMWDGLPGGESFRQFHRRVTSGLEESLAELGACRLVDGRPHLWTEPNPLRVVAVAHGGTNAVALGHLLGLEPTPWEWDRFDSPHASVARLGVKPIAHAVAFSLLRFGDVAHLRADQVTR